MERTQAKKILAAFFELHRAANDIDDVDAGEQVLNEALRNHGCDESLRISFAAACARCARRRRSGSGRTHSPPLVGRRVSASRQPLFHQRRGLAHVRAARNPGLEQRHDLADGLRTRDAGFCDGRVDSGCQFRFGHLLR